MAEDFTKLFGYYHAYNVESGEDDPLGWFTSVEVCTDEGEWVQIAFYYDSYHDRVEKVSVLKKGKHY